MPWLLVNGLLAVTAASASDYSAVIGEDGAWFTFPRPRQRTWEWDRERSGHASLEYGWTVRFTDGKAIYSLAVAHFKESGAFEEEPVAPSEGTLEDLLAVCQKDLWMEPKPGMRSRVEGDALTARVVDDRLEFEVTSAKALELLQTIDGPRVIFETWRNDTPVRQKWVKVTRE